MAEEPIGLSLDDTPRSRRAVTEIFTDEEEKKSLVALLQSAQRTLADVNASATDRNGAAKIIKDFLELKHGKKEVDVPHFRLSIRQVSGDYVELSPDGLPIIGKSGKPIKREVAKKNGLSPVGHPLREGDGPVANPPITGRYASRYKKLQAELASRPNRT